MVISKNPKKTQLRKKFGLGSFDCVEENVSGWSLEFGWCVLCTDERSVAVGCRLPVGLLRLRAGLPPADRHVVRAVARLILESVRRVSLVTEVSARPLSCWAPVQPLTNFSVQLAR